MRETLAGMLGLPEPRKRPARPFAQRGYQQPAQAALAPSTSPAAGGNINAIAQVMNAAIGQHHDLPLREKIANSLTAQRRVAEHIGLNSEGKTFNLMSKNQKLMKAEKQGGKSGEPVKLPDGRGVETIGLALSPAYKEEGFESCVRYASCKDSCLGKTSGGNFIYGGGKDMSAVKGPRLKQFKRTQAFLRDPGAFGVKLHDEIEAAEKLAAKHGNKLGVRLNVLSDIHPKVYKKLRDSFPDVSFYDYTKSAAKAADENHHLTYSSTGVSQPAGINGVMHDLNGKPVAILNPHQNWQMDRKFLDRGDNVAMAFTHKHELPRHVLDVETGHRYRVIDGDTHDYRPLDKVKGETGVIIGLRNKKTNSNAKNAAHGSNGFFVHWEPSAGPDAKIAPQAAPKGATHDT